MINLVDRYHNDRYMRGIHPRYVDRSKVPVRRIFVHHWVGWYGLPEDATQAQEVAAIDAVANDHFNRFGIGPGYNFVAMPSGRTYYVGRIDTERRHTSNINPATGRAYNWDSLAISTPGNWEKAIPREPMLRAIHELINDLRDRPDVLDDADVMGHRDVYSTSCPGSHLYQFLPRFRRRIEPESDEMSDERMKQIAWEATESQRRLALEVAYAIAGVPDDYSGDAVKDARAAVQAIVKRGAPVWNALQAQNAVLHDLRDIIERLEAGTTGFSQEERDELADLIDAVGDKLREA